MSKYIVLERYYDKRERFFYKTERSFTDYGI